MKPNFARIKDPKISALIGGSYRLESREVGIEKLRWLCERYEVSKESRLEAEPESITLWIQGFGLDGPEIKKGYRGNFGKVSLVARKGGGFTFETVKLVRALKYHPLRRRTKQPMPNPGHPTIRRAKQRKRFYNKQEAIKLLSRLHDEFPDATISAGPERLYTLVFSREFTPKLVKKFVLEVVPEDGAFVINFFPNQFEEQRGVRRVDALSDSHLRPRPSGGSAEAPEGWKGRFASHFDEIRAVVQSPGVRTLDPEAEKAAAKPESLREPEEPRRLEASEQPPEATALPEAADAG